MEFVIEPTTGGGTPVDSLGGGVPVMETNCPFELVADPATTGADPVTSGSDSEATTAGREPDSAGAEPVIGKPRAFVETTPGGRIFLIPPDADGTPPVRIPIGFPAESVVLPPRTGSSPADDSAGVEAVI